MVEWIHFSIEHWHSKTCRLSFACWHTLSVGFDRPFHSASELFLWGIVLCVLLVPSRCGRTGEGHLWCASWVTSLSTLSRSATIMIHVLAELQVDNGVDHAHHILKFSFSFLPQYSLWLFGRQIKQHFKNHAIGERSMKVLIPLLACLSESFKD